MRRFSYLCLFVFALLFFFSCKPDKNSVTPLLGSQKMIVGTWTMQQEEYAQYIDGVKQIDTTVNATDNNRAYVKFNSNGTFSSAGLYTAPNVGGLNNGLLTAADSTSGTFGLTGSAITLSEPIAGLTTSTTVIGVNASAPPVITPVSHLASVSLLTAESLKIHTEYTYTYTVNNTSQTYKMVDDYFYTK
jgi:hypothetical protein